MYVNDHNKILRGSSNVCTMRICATMVWGGFPLQIQTIVEHCHAWSQALVESRGEALDPGGGVNTAVGEAAELVSDSDLTVTAQTLQLATAVLRHQPAAGATVAQKARSWLSSAGPELLLHEVTLWNLRRLVFQRSSGMWYTSHQPHAGSLSSTPRSCTYDRAFPAPAHVRTRLSIST